VSAQREVEARYQKRTDRIDDHLGDAQAIIAQTNATAQNITSNLQDQREHLINVGTNVRRPCVLVSFVSILSNKAHLGAAGGRHARGHARGRAAPQEPQVQDDVADPVAVLYYLRPLRVHHLEGHLQVQLSRASLHIHKRRRCRDGEARGVLGSMSIESIPLGWTPISVVRAGHTQGTDPLGEVLCMYVREGGDAHSTQSQVLSHSLMDLRAGIYSSPRDAPIVPLAVLPK
jgi:hypothetical protein